MTSAIYINEPPVQKEKIDVEVMLTDAAGIRGSFFMKQGERIIDMLNDTRMFVPFEDTQGQVHMLNKSQIIRVRPMIETRARSAAAEQFGFSNSR